MRRPLPFLLVPLAIALQLVAHSQPALVEHIYANAIFPAVARVLGALNALVPFPVAELLALAAAAALTAFVLRGLARFVRRSEPRRILIVRGLRFGAALVGGVYLAFLFCWGFNYARPPLAERAKLGARAPARQEMIDLARELLLGANALRDGRLEDASGVFRLAEGPAAALRTVATGYDAAAREDAAFLLGPSPAPKRALLSEGLSRLGISGLYVPFTAEPLVNAKLPEVELPWSGAHEQAHARGIAREDEANFAAFLGCRSHPHPDFRYSAALLGGLYALEALALADRDAGRELAFERSAAVERDLEAMRAFSRRYTGRLRDAGERVNDAYLRSQGQRGIASYGLVVDLLLAERRRRGRVLGSPP